MKNYSENFYLKVIEFGSTYKEGFTYSEIIKNENLNLKEWEKSILKNHFTSAHINYVETIQLSHSGHSETIFSVIKRGGSDYTDDIWKYTISFDAHFKYYDYLELKFARENSESARRYAVGAIILSAISIIIALIIPLAVTQTVEIKKENNQSEPSKNPVVRTLPLKID